MSIKKKLLISFGLVLLVAIGAFTTVYLSLQNVGKSYTHLVDVEVHKLNLAREIQYQDLLLTDSVKGIIINPSGTADIEIYNNVAVELDNNIQEVRTLISNERAIQIFEELDQYNQTLVDLESQIIALAASNQEAATELYNGEYSQIREIFSSDLEEFKQLQTEIISEQTVQDEQLIQSRSVYGLVTVGIALIIGIAIALFVSQSITRPIQQVVKKLDELSENEGDLTARLEINSKDEIGMLAGSFNKMIANIQTIIKQVQTNTIELASASEQLFASSEQNSEATHHVTSAIQEIAAGSEKQGLGTEESSKAMVEIASDIQRVADSSAAVAESSILTTENALEGDKSVKRSIEQMNNIQHSVTEAESQVRNLDKLSGEIGKILDVITGIADQTNLLALNAAIEAARAGEHGKGFAVVADEVRKLAEESKTSASGITKLIEEIRINTSHAVTYMKKGTEEVEVGIEVVHQAGRAFATILESVQKVSAQVQEVTAASQQISAGTEEVTSSIVELSHIAKEATSSSQNVAASSEEQLASIEEISSSAGSLSTLAEELHALVGKFKV